MSRSELPELFVSKMKDLLGGELKEFLDSYEQPRAFGIRVNTLKVGMNEFLEKSPFAVTSVPWAAEGLYYEEGERPGKHPYYHAGLYYIQEPSAMSPVELLDVHPGERVLDLCAAPGGKSTQIAAKLQGRGVLVVNDNHSDRVKALVKNLELFGVRNAVVLNEKPERMLAPFAGFFDKILIDAPCSGEGMFRKEEGMMAQWERHSVTECSLMQHELLGQAAQMLAPGGRLVYSTCTFSPEENEAQIAEFLDSHEDFEVVRVFVNDEMNDEVNDEMNNEVKGKINDGMNDEFKGKINDGMNDEVNDKISDKISDEIRDEIRDRIKGKSAGVGFSSGRPDWLRMPWCSEGAYSARAVAAVADTVRLWPHRLKGEGHFVAVLRQTGTAAALSAAVVESAAAQPVAATSKRSGRGGALREARAAAPQAGVSLEPLQAFGRELLRSGRVPEAAERLVCFGEHAYAAPEGLPELNGVKIVRPGWYLGALHRGRFQPSHAMAMGLLMEDATRTINLLTSDGRVIRYLKGETLEVAEHEVVRDDPALGARGYCLICVDGFAVGWGKWSEGMLKNEYPSGWRWT
ncbi:RsmB/NOP family class I SAM-dependent RNA methyltransferase [Paenibacillus eucommiae]|uniref:NOL1/NOP2/sun family putative RNA methylase n=1 Tax=Paenibacillus eucommiae TaxID=1355755 RepID=A0ABS4INT6_9BACL|nr:RsmB/NOP family class I SAM-dependent RNA methyltransferase [Paenibacillus eucommiae]MBP1989232.1 NOL1/NOP2/sun family putative RNA methylase [Paenibacillus eucommiae]